MNDLTELASAPFSIGLETVLVLVTALAVAVGSGGGLSRGAHHVVHRFCLVTWLGFAASLTGHPAVEMAVGVLVLVFVFVFGLSRRGALRLALLGFVLGALGNIAVITANGAMPVKDETGTLRLTADQQRKYEPITESTKLPWLADLITVPVSGSIASLGDMLLWISMAVGIVAVSHSPDGKGGTGRRRTRGWHQARFDASIGNLDMESARDAADAGVEACRGLARRCQSPSESPHSSNDDRRLPVGSRRGAGHSRRPRAPQRRSCPVPPGLCRCPHHGR